MKTETNNPNKKSEKSAPNIPSQTRKSSTNYWWAYLTIVIVCIGITGYVIYNSQNKSNVTAELEEQYKMLQNDLSSRDSLINEWVLAFQEIEADLNTMKKKESILFSQSDDPEFTDDMRQRILDDIQSLNSLLKENKEKAALLDRKLRKSGVKIAALQQRVNEMEINLAERDSSIQNLKMELVDRDFMMADLNLLIDSLDSEVTQKQQIISQKEDLLNRAYFAKGTIKELEQNGVIKKEGGFLGLGKSKKVSDQFQEEFFSKLDITKTNKINVNAKDVELISEHPNNSYKLVSNDSLVAYIEIENPEEFWKLTRYAVVETGK